MGERPEETGISNKSQDLHPRFVLAILQAIIRPHLADTGAHGQHTLSRLREHPPCQHGGR